MPMDNIEISLIDNINENDVIYIESASNNESYGIDMINVKEMWDKGYKGKGVKIAVIDTGCDINHNDLKKRIIGGRNFTSEDKGNKNIYLDYNGHGTHVAGIIVAEGNSNNIVGVAPEASLLILKVLDKDGTGSMKNVVDAINYAINKKVDIISMSLGSTSQMLSLEKVIKRANDKGILVVCAAGNEGDNNKDTDELLYPGSYNEVISVGAIDKFKSAARFTNSNKEIDVVAPGVNIVSTYPDNKYAILSGTSMATPFVTGVLSLLIEWSNYEFGRRLSEVELYGQLIKNTVSINLARTIQGNGIVYLKIR